MSIASAFTRSPTSSTVITRRSRHGAKPTEAKSAIVPPASSAASAASSSRGANGMGVSTPRLWSLSLSPSSAASSRRSSASARTSPSDAASTRPSATEMYVALREMERDAEEAELKCVTNAGSSSEAQQCTADFVEASDDIELARLGAKASGTDTQEERVIARAAVKRARQQRAASVSEAERAELDCVRDGGGAECTVAFNNAWDAAEEHERDAVLRHRSILRRWVMAHR